MLCCGWATLANGDVAGAPQSFWPPPLYRRCLGSRALRRRALSGVADHIDAPLDAPIGNEPNECDQHVEGVCDPDLEESQQDRRGIEHRRQLALQVPPDGTREQ